MSEPTRAALRDRIIELEQERDRWREVAPSDPEAHAIAACVKALDKIAPKPGGYAVSTSYGSDTGHAKVGRVLGYLAQRYGVESPS